MKRLLPLTYVLLFVFLSLILYLPVQAELKVTSFQLSNGLRVILAPVDHVQATCVLFYHIVGTRDDPADIKGGSYLFQNLMLSGTEHLDGFERLLYIKRSGSISNRMVNYDYSIFSQVVPETEINNALWLERERISSLRLNATLINNEKDNIYTRNYRLNTLNVNSRALNWVHAKIFEGTIYETPIYGNLEELRQFAPTDIEKLYANFRNLSNIILVITGKFDAAEIRSSVSQHFADLPYTAPIPRKRYVEIQPRKQYTFDNIVSENIQEPFVLYGIRGPAKPSFDYLYFDFIRYYLVDERMSQLEKVLNHDYNLDATIDHFITNLYESNALVIKISCKNRSNLERAKVAVNKVLDAIKNGKSDFLSSNAFRDTKTLMEIDFLKQMMSLEQRSIFLAENFHFTGNLNSETHYLNRIRKLTTMDVYRIGRKYFDRNNRVNMNVYPAGK